MRVCTLPALVLTLLASGTGEPNAQAQDKPPEAIKVPEKVKKDLGENTIAILTGATRVEVFRLGKGLGKGLMKEGRPKATPNTIEQWPITATGKEKDKEFAAKVRAFLFDEATRTPSGAGGFQGDVAFRLWKEKESVTVVVFFEGHSFRVITRDAEGKQTNRTGGGFLFNAKGEFDKGDLFARVKALAVEAFPDDEPIKALKKPQIEFVDPFKPLKK